MQETGRGMCRPIIKLLRARCRSPAYRVRVRRVLPRRRRGEQSTTDTCGTDLHPFGALGTSPRVGGGRARRGAGRAGELHHTGFEAGPRPRATPGARGALGAAAASLFDALRKSSDPSDPLVGAGDRESENLKPLFILIYDQTVTQKEVITW